MGIRAVLRLVMVGLAATVGLLVWARWEPEPGAESASASRPVPEMPTGEREARSSTRSLDVAQFEGDREIMYISASRQLDFEDGWNIWEGPLVVIHGGDTDTDTDDVRISGDTMRTAGEVGSMTEVRIIGNVAASLPGGGNFTTRRIDYDAITGIASNCNRNNLEYSGLAVRSDCLNFRTVGDATAGGDLSAEELRMWGDLAISAAQGDGGSLPEGLSGGGEELRFRPGGEVVRIDGAAALAFGETVIRADGLDLRVGSSVRELEGVEAGGDARLRMGSTADGRPARLLSGDDLTMDIVDDGVSSVGATGSPARLQLAGQGTLLARTIELSVTGDRLEVRARGRVGWTGESRESDGPRSLSAGSLLLRSSSDRLERLAADGGVEMQLGGASSATLTGPRVSMQWAGDEVASFEWPEGLTLEDPGRSVSAGEASGGAEGWVLEGDPRPRISADGISLAADRLRLPPEGDSTAFGDVRGTLGGDRLAAGAALFGDVPQVQVRSGIAVLGDDGRTVLRESVQVVWETQSLVTEELRLERSPGRLRALRDVELVASLAPGSDDAELVTVTASDLLVEQDSGEIRVAGEARLRQDERTIAAERMAILLGDSGRWETIEADGAVSFQEPQVQAEGVRLEYDLSTRELLLLGDEERPARFVYGDLEYQSAEALRVIRQGDDVVIEATEAGRTTTKVVRAGETEGGGA